MIHSFSLVRQYVCMLYVVTCVHTYTNNRGRCYDQNFLLFSTLFGEKIMAFFSKANVTIKFSQKRTVCSL
jgi:hypothetical protein